MCPKRPLLSLSSCLHVSAQDRGVHPACLWPPAVLWTGSRSCSSRVRAGKPPLPVRSSSQSPVTNTGGGAWGLQVGSRWDGPQLSPPESASHQFPQERFQDLFLPHWHVQDPQASIFSFFQQPPSLFLYRVKSSLFWLLHTFCRTRFNIFLLVYLHVNQ